MINMVCMIILWFAASFCYYLISYQLKYIKGDIYINGLVSATSELFAYAISGYLLQILGLTSLLRISYGLGVVGMVCLILIPTENQVYLAIFILGAKFGISSAYNMVFLGN